MISYKLIFLLACSVTVLTNACSERAEIGCRNGIESPCIPNKKPHEKLSEYNLYSGILAELNPVNGLIPYDLNTELFSDYTRKQRFVYVPADTMVAYVEEGILDFPVGTVLIKNFYYDLDQTNQATERLILETRLLMHQEKGWTAETYVWNEQQDEAFLQQAGDQKEVSWVSEKGNSRKVIYLIPTKNDCKSCHSQDNVLSPLGPKAPNLNKVYNYRSGDQNQLAHWQQAGILEGFVDLSDAPKAPVWNGPNTGTLEQRARIYLDVNCGNCHSQTGSASNSGLYLTYDEEDPRKLGVFKPPVAAGSGSGGLKFSIVPGKPDESILVYRMEAVHPAIRMPEIGRTLVHDDAVKLVREWIQKMESSEGNSEY